MNSEFTESTESEGRGAGQGNIKCIVALLMGRSLLIGGGKLAELGDGGGDYVQGEINVCGSGVAAEAEAQAGAGFFRRQADGGKHVRWLDGARGAGGSRGTGQTFQIQRNEAGFPLDAR